MQELEKILEEIESEALHNSEIGRKQCEGMAMAMNIIRKHMNDGWISVEEQLPEVGEHVLVSFINDGFIPAIAIVSENGKWLMLQGAKGFNDITDYVIAWRPLPKSYKPKRSDNHDGE